MMIRSVWASAVLLGILEAGDLQLQQGSLCIDAGIATYLTTDYAGNRRKFGNAVDIGAFERPPPQGTILKFR